MKNRCSTALKEWAVVVKALTEGRQLLLFRKGGIREVGKDFSVEENEFFLFPTFEHQHPEGIREEFRPWLTGLPRKTPQTLPIETFVTVEKVFHLKDPEAAQELRPYHIYSEDKILERFQYKPTKPLCILLLRVFRVPTVSIVNLPSYAGCRSWVPLGKPLSTAGAEPVLSESAFREKTADIFKKASVYNPAQ